MKSLFTLFFVLLVGLSYAQYPVKQGLGNEPHTIVITNALQAKQGFINARYTDTTAANKDSISRFPGSQIAVGNAILVRDSTATKWLINGTIGATSTIIQGGPITSIPVKGFDPGQNISSDSFIVASFYQSEGPTATISGGVPLEFRSSQAMSYTLNWTAGRQASTAPLQSVVVVGQSQTFSQPSAGTSVSGTYNVTFPANTNVTYSNVVITADSKSSTASTTFSFLPQRYFGWISTADTAGIGTFGYDDSKIYGLTNELSASKAKTWNTGNPAGTQIYVYAYYSTAGTLNNLILNGFPSIDAFNVVQRNFTNALGFQGQWIIYWNKNGQTLSSDIIAN